MSFGSLDLLMKNEYKATEEALAAITYQILWGLAYLHYDLNIHRDIKPGKKTYCCNNNLESFSYSTTYFTYPTMSYREHFTGQKWPLQDL